MKHWVRNVLWLVLIVAVAVGAYLAWNWYHAKESAVSYRTAPVAEATWWPPSAPPVRWSRRIPSTSAAGDRADQPVRNRGRQARRQAPGLPLDL